MLGHVSSYLYAYLILHHDARRHSSYKLETGVKGVTGWESAAVVMSAGLPVTDGAL